MGLLRLLSLLLFCGEVSDRMHANTQFRRGGLMHFLLSEHPVLVPFIAFGAFAGGLLGFFVVDEPWLYQFFPYRDRFAGTAAGTGLGVAAGFVVGTPLAILGTIVSSLREVARRRQLPRPSEGLDFHAGTVPLETCRYLRDW